MKLQELMVCAQEGRIDSLELISLEGGTYVLEALMGDHSVSVQDANGVVVHLRSVEHARDLLQGMPVLPFHLVHAEVHDEMCGMPPAASEPLRVPISMRSAW
jgi:hypothetical protein